MKDASYQLSKAELEKILVNALDILCDKDKAILINEANERSISFRLALHLQMLLPDCDVDCEYNRNNLSAGGIKRLYEGPVEEIYSNDVNAKTVFPDVIVHERNTSKNLLVIEMKKNKAGKDALNKDREKLKGYMVQDELKYKFGALVIVNTPEPTYSYELKSREEFLETKEALPAGG